MPERWLTILMPGRHAARRIDRGYASFVRGIERRIREGDRRQRAFHRLAVGELFLAIAVGLAAGSLRYLFLIPVLFVLWPIVAWGDLRIWPRIYRRATEGLGFWESLLANFDPFYLFALGA